jgi:hypothetical protein
LGVADFKHDFSLLNIETSTQLLIFDLDIDNPLGGAASRQIPIIPVCILLI